jgi:hypothetical protein
MAVNRYDRPAQQLIPDTYAAMPYKEMLLAGKAQQAQLDKLDAARIALGDKEFKNLQKDDERAAMARNWLETETGKIADLYGQDMGKARSAYKNLEREAKKRFGPSGDIGALQSSYDAAQAYRKKLEDAEVDPLRIDKLVSEATNAYQGIGEGDEFGRYNTYQGQRAAQNYNYADWVNTNLSDLEAITGAYAEVTPDGKGYIWKKKGTNEEVSNERIQQAAMQLARGDENLLYNIAEGDRLGLDSSNAFKSAVAGGGTKYAYTKKTRDKSLTSDATALRAMDKADEVAANEVFHFSNPSAYITRDDSDVSFVADMGETNNKLAEAQTNIDAINEEIQGYYLRDADGNVEFDPNTGQPAVNPDFATNHNAAVTKLGQQQRLYEKAENDRILQEKTYIEAVAEVTGQDVSGKKVQKILDSGNVVVEDEDVVVGFLDENGNRVTLSEANYSTNNVNVNTKAKKDKMWADATSKGLTPVYGSKTIDIYDKDMLSKIKTTLNERKAKSEDYMIDYYTESDFKLSPQTAAIKENMIDNIGEGMDIMVTDENNRLVVANKKLRDLAIQYAPLSTTKALTEVADKIKSEEISVEDGKVLIKLLELNQLNEGASSFRENTKLIGTTRGPNGYAILEDPNGNRIALKPKEGPARESYNRMIKNSDKQIYVATGDELFLNRGYAMEYPDKYNELKELKGDISTQVSKNPGQNLSKRPLYLDNGYYLNVVRGENEATVQVFLSKSSAVKDQPGPGDSTPEIISLEKLDQVGLNLMATVSSL